MRTGFILPVVLIIALGVIALGAGAYFLLKPEISLLPSPQVVVTPPITITPRAKIDPLDNWATYRNEEYGYEIDYPQNWEVVEAMPNTNLSTVDLDRNLIEDQHEVQKVTFFERDDNYAPGKFQVIVKANTEQLTLEQWIDANRVADPEMTKIVGDTMLDGKPAKVLSGFSLDGSVTTGVIALNGNYVFSVYFINVVPEDPNLEKHQLIYRRMLSSFDFVE